MKIAIGIVLANLLFMASTLAASFDCAKATTKIEKIICTDAEASTLDEKLAAAYKAALNNEARADTTRLAQKQWLRERNGCKDVACVKQAYETRLASLTDEQPSDRAGKALAPFEYTQDETLTGQRYIGQKKRPVCQDLLDYLNHPRSNALFKPDGTLARESDKFKSVSWEPLDKSRYREGYASFIDAISPDVRTEYMRRYEDPGWALQRTQAHPTGPRNELEQAERWLYRLVHLRPYTRNMHDPTSQVELPTWFHFGHVEWLGYADGRSLVRNHTSLDGRPSSEWVIYAGVNYAVSNQTFGDGKGVPPTHLKLDVHELMMNGQGQAFLYWVCAYRAKNMR